MDDWKEAIKQGDIKVNVLGDVAGKTLIFTLPAGTPDAYVDVFQEEMKEAFPEAKEIIIVKGDFIRQIDIIG